MSPTVITLIVAATATLVVLVVLAWSVVRRVREAIADVTVLRDRVMPQIEALTRDVEGISTQLERLADAAASIKDASDG